MTLETRVSEAFSQALPSGEISDLLDEVFAAEAAARVKFDGAKAEALNPATHPSAVATARKAMEDAEFAAERMTAAAIELRRRLEETQRAEREEAEAQARREAIAERDALAEDLKEFRELTDRMVALLTRLSQNNRKLNLGRVGHDEAHKSFGSSAEMIAFGLDRPDHTPSILTGTKLVSFAGSASWPPTKRGWTHYP